MIIIGISGKAGSGKDASANILKTIAESRGKKVLITHYADLLKFICKQYLGWNGEKDEYGRHLLQFIGTEIFRDKVDKDYWVKFVLNMIVLFGYRYDYVIIPDVRFENEIDVPREHGQKVVHLQIRRPNAPILPDGESGHSSETVLDTMTPDCVIVNDGTFDDLVEKLRLFEEEL